MSRLAITPNYSRLLELFTDSGAGTLVRRGQKVNTVSKMSDFSDVELLKKTLVREREALDARQTAERYVDFLGQREFTALYDDGMEGLAIVLPPSSDVKGPQLSQLSTLTLSKAAWLTNLSDNLFATIKRHFPKLMWTVKQDDENLTWFFDKADGSLTRNGEVLFWYGLEDGEDVRDLMIEFNKHGRDIFGDTNLDTKFARAARRAGELLGGATAQMTQKRTYSTLRSRLPSQKPGYLSSSQKSSSKLSSSSFQVKYNGINGMNVRRRKMPTLQTLSSRSYTTPATTNPNPPFGAKNASNSVPAKVALIGT